MFPIYPSVNSSQYHSESSTPNKISLSSVCPVFSSRSEILADLKSAIDTFKGSKVAAVRPLLLAAEENLHNMVVDLDKAVTKVCVFYKENKKYNH